MILLSACLAGTRCRYDGTHVLKEELRSLLNSGKAVAVCPELLGGLPVPRVPCEIRIVGGERRVIGRDGHDYSAAFMRGAERSLKICRRLGIQRAVLKSRSPSCGYGSIYSGDFSGTLVPGNGITAALLEGEGIHIFTEEDYRAGEMDTAPAL